MLEMDNAAVPLLVTVKVCAAVVTATGEVKLKLVCDKPTIGASTPVVRPFNATLRGLPPALSLIVIAPLRVPATVGVKVTVMVHVPLGAMACVQLLVCA